MALIGKFSETPFTDLIQFYTSSRQTVAVTVSLTDGRGDDGVFYIEEGDVVDAWLGDSVGRDAIRRALRLSGGSFRVEPNIRAAERTINEPWKQLLFEEMVQLDEENRQGKKKGSDGASSEGPAGATVLDASPAELLAAAAAAGPGTPAVAEPVAAPEPAAGKKKPPVALIGGVAGAVVVAIVVAIVVAKPSPKPGPAADKAAATTGAAQPDQPAKTPGAAALPALTFGMVAPLNGPSKDLGQGIKTGLEVAFAAANDAGGVNGKRLELVALDDGNEPARTADGMRDLIEVRKVFAVVGNAAAASKASQAKVPLIGALGSTAPNGTPDRYVFGYRPTLAEETAAAVHYLVDVRRVAPSAIAVFAQDDDFGEAGWKGVIEALKGYGQAPDRIVRASYKRNKADVGDAVKKLRGVKDLKAVVMVATEAAASRLIEGVLDVAPNTIFTDVSAVDLGTLSDDLAGAHVPVKENVIVTQVVPLPRSRATGVAKYRAALDRYKGGEDPSALSLEGWVVGSLVVEALRNAGPNPDADAMVSALEKLKLDVGIGAPLGFSPTDHQASHKVYGATLDASGEWKQIDLQ